MAIETHHDDLTMLYRSVPFVFSTSMFNGLHCLLITLQNWNVNSIVYPQNPESLEIANLAQSYILKKKGIIITGNFISALDGKIVECKWPCDDHW